MKMPANLHKIEGDIEEDSHALDDEADLEQGRIVRDRYLPALEVYFCRLGEELEYETYFSFYSVSNSFSRAFYEFICGYSVTSSFSYC